MFSRSRLAKVFQDLGPVATDEPPEESARRSDSKHDSRDHARRAVASFFQLSRDADNWIQAGIAGSLYLRWQNRRCGIVFHRFPARIPVSRLCSVRRGQVGRQLFGARLLCLELGVVGLFLIRIQQNVSRLRDLIEDLL